VSGSDIVLIIGIIVGLGFIAGGLVAGVYVWGKLFMKVSEEIKSTPPSDPLVAPHLLGRKCMTCEGTGQQYGAACAACDGTGLER
jgi:hypothetical protein